MMKVNLIGDYEGKYRIPKTLCILVGHSGIKFVISMVTL
jgi:hypothetical protein